MDCGYRHRVGHNHDDLDWARLDGRVLSDGTGHDDAGGRGGDERESRVMHFDAV